MLPLSFFTLCIFAILWVYNAKLNYDIYMEHPAQNRNLNLLPRALVDQLSAEFTFLLSLCALSLIIIAFIDIDVTDPQILAGGCILAVFDFLDLMSKRRLDRELKKGG
ncbi:hypothetical protein ES703_17872 [subsurface metagenome]